MTGYPLEALLALRARAEEEARAALGAALVDEEGARQERDRRVAAVHACASRREAAERDLATACEAGAGTLRERAAHAARLRADEHAARAALVDATARLGAKTAESARLAAATAAARASCGAVERHRDDWRRARRHAEEQADEARADELAAARAFPSR